MEEMTQMKNASGSVVQFKIDMAPGVESLVYDVAPGDVCEVPSGYVETGYIEKLAPGLVCMDAPEPETTPSETSSEPSPPAEEAKGRKGRKGK